jgi:cyclophilin family peptidyl-prolyl cis-trans isomerase
MIQTGDPRGDGAGGESIWGEEFADELDPDAKHEKGTVSMANAGPNTQGSVCFADVVLMILSRALYAAFLASLRYSPRVSLLSVHFLLWYPAIFHH